MIIKTIQYILYGTKDGKTYEPVDFPLDTQWIEGMSAEEHATRFLGYEHARWDVYDSIDSKGMAH